MGIDWEDVVKFHGHACPGLAKGYIMTKAAMSKLEVKHAHDEELVAIVENKSCAVDAVQVVAGCTFGKGNFIFRDYGKQVITLAKRATGEAVRVAVKADVSAQRAARDKTREEYIDMILKAPAQELLDIKKVEIKMPPEASVYPTLICQDCHEGVMEPAAQIVDEHVFCIPCFIKNQSSSGMIAQDPTIA